MESESDVGVRVTEVRLHGFLMCEYGVRETGKKWWIGKARRGIRIWCWCRGDVGGKAPPLQTLMTLLKEHCNYKRVCTGLTASFSVASLRTTHNKNTISATDNWSATNDSIRQ